MSALSEWRDTAIGVGVGVPIGTGLGAALCTGLGGVTGPGTVLGAIGGGGAVWAWSRLSDRGVAGGPSGFASSAEIAATLSPRAVRRSARVTRPGLMNHRSTAVTNCGVYLGKARSGSRRRCYASFEDVVLVVAPPRSGKTAWMGGAVGDAPGAAVVTSTKSDLYEHTHRYRRHRGPIYVLNPEGLSGIATTLRWSPISGCHLPEVAISRADYLLSGSSTTQGVSDKEFWQGNAFKVLRCYLWAAAATQRPMSELRNWINKQSDRTALRILERHPNAPDGWHRELAQILEEAPQRTRESVFLTLSLTFQFMANPAVAEAVEAPPGGEQGFDVGCFIKERGTLYLIGSAGAYDSLAPLMAALTGHVFETAKRIAAGRPNRRLDPPLTMALDEASLICPIPLDRWTSDAGGRGISLLIAVQSPSQLYDRWGERGGETIWDNATVKLIFGGLTVGKHLREIAELCGERETQQRSHSHGGGHSSVSTTPKPVDVLSQDELRRLGRFEALLLGRTVRPVLLKIKPVWERKDYNRITSYAAVDEAVRVDRGPVLAPPRPTVPIPAAPPSPASPPAARRPAPSRPDQRVADVVPLQRVRQTATTDEEAAGE